VLIALDDFGSGYSSLSYLHAFPFDRIKIDRAFISDLESNHHSKAIVRAVLQLGRSLKVPTLAEGVETEGQRRFLAKESCDAVQGYLTGRPQAIEDYGDVVGRNLTGHARRHPITLASEYGVERHSKRVAGTR
jgi:EAL domain-containing protein (putative c-di-GMP-specific phosphodiesterase class I)